MKARADGMALGRLIVLVNIAGPFGHAEKMLKELKANVSRGGMLCHRPQADEINLGEKIDMSVVSVRKNKKAYALPIMLGLIGFYFAIDAFYLWCTYQDTDLLDRIVCVVEPYVGISRPLISGEMARLLLNQCSGQAIPDARDFDNHIHDQSVPVRGRRFGLAFSRFYGGAKEAHSSSGTLAQGRKILSPT